MVTAIITITIIMDIEIMVIATMATTIITTITGIGM